MKLARTLNDIQLLRTVSPSGVSWSEALAMMLDIMTDIREESGRELSAMKFDDEAVKAWRTLANTLLTVPMDEAAAGMSERSRDRLEQYKRQLADNIKAAGALQGELDAALGDEERLRAQAEEYEKKKELLSESRRSAAELSERIERLRHELSAIRDVDPDELTRVYAGLQSEKERKQQLNKELASGAEKLRIIKEECGALNAQADGMKASIAAAESSRSEAAALKESKETELDDLLHEREVLSAELSALDKGIAEQRTAVEALSKECEAKRAELQSETVKKEKLSEDNAADAERLRVLTEECAALRNEAEGMEATIAAAEDDRIEAEALKISKEAELEKIRRNRETLNSTLDVLDTGIAEQKEAVNALNKEVVAKNVELQEQKKLLSATQIDRDNRSEQVINAKNARDELLRENEQLEGELSSITEQIVDLKSQRPDLKNRIEEQRAVLEAERENQDAEIQLLSQQVSELKAQAMEADAKVGSLSSEMNAYEEKLRSGMRRAEELTDEINALSEEISLAENRCIELNGEKNDLINRRQRYSDDIYEYEQFFDSQECQKTREDIKRYGLIIDEYRNAIATLFGRPAYVEQLGELKAGYREMKQRLGYEMADIQNLYNNLSMDYINVVQEIEERVKL